MSVQSLRGFRKLLRASRTVFGKDRDGLLTARAFIRQQFEENRNETDPEVLDELLFSIDDAISFAQTNIVQAELNEKGNYEANITPEHAEVLKTQPQISEAKDPAKITSSGGCKNAQK
eukprot:INCI5782.1.p1 GENE.INCI5782.1~~INCI5782.1.p1  ORF type:complete len:118 (-),score=25.10 INCI5782.1:444-797(-)